MLRRILALAVAFIVSGQALAADNAPTVVDLNQEPQAQMSKAIGNLEDQQRYGISFKGSNVRAEVRVNDMPVFFKILRNDEEVTTTYNEWVKRGLNVVRISLERFDDKKPYSVSFNVFYQSPTQIVTDERTVLYSSRDDVLLPLRQDVGVRAPNVPQLRVWQAEDVTFDDDEKARLLEAINSLRTRLRDAMAKGDNTYLATFDKPLRDQIATAYGRPFESASDILERRKKLLEQFSSLINAPVDLTPELKMSDLVFDQYAQGRLIRVSRTDGTPLIQAKRGPVEYTIDRPVYGSLGGIWERLR